MNVLNRTKKILKDWFGEITPASKIKPDFDPIILPIIRRVMPSIIAHDIIGVQPMTGPIESIATLRARYADSQKSTMEQLLENTRKQLEKKKDEDI